MQRNKIRRVGALQKKIILLLQAGVALSFSQTGKKQLKILDELSDKWHKINQGELTRSIYLLYHSKLIDQKINKDGTITFVLNKEGKRYALEYDLDKMQIKTPPRWDKKWRIVIFDVPVRLRRVRNSLRFHLGELGFYKLQHSVFVHPFPCSAEIEYISEFYNARRYVRFIEATFVDNELHLKREFNLI